MMETVLIWVLGAIGAYFALSFLVAAAAIGLGFYFIWKLTK